MAGQIDHSNESVPQNPAEEIFQAFLTDVSDHEISIINNDESSQSLTLTHESSIGSSLDEKLNLVKRSESLKENIIDHKYEPCVLKSSVSCTESMDHHCSASKSVPVTLSFDFGTDEKKKQNKNQKDQKDTTDSKVDDNPEKSHNTGKNTSFRRSSLPSKKISFFTYMYSELTRGYLLEYDEEKYTEKRERVYTFMKIPREVEKFIIFGFMQCVEVFLYVFTFLPLRFLMALVKLLGKLVLSPCWRTPGRVLEPAQICDLLKGFIILSVCFLLGYVDVSMMYHIIRGQAIIKLYIFFNMLEVADRLFSSFGQDLLDALFWTATEPRGRRREHVGLLPHLALAILYVFLHAVLVLFQATTLNVAFNSHNKSLLTIMMSNNFVELKGSVFKKFEKNNLFQMACSDVRERFHFMVLLTIVCVRNLTEFSWNMEHLWVLIPDILIVMGAELLVDWVKHAFITKFNGIPVDVYRDYRISIAYDIAASRHNNAFADHLDMVSRRMGFIPLPLAVILIRVFANSVKINDLMGFTLICLFYLCLVTLKILNSIVLLGKAVDYVEQTGGKMGDNVFKKQKPEAPTCDKPTGRFHRSSSVGSRLGSVAAFPDYEPTLQGRPSVTPKLLFSNSAVDLNSMGLNEEYASQNYNNAATNIEKDGTRQRNSVKINDKSPLSEVQRYTMCHNQIIN